MPNTRVSDVVVPEIFTPYVQQKTQEKSRIIQSGALLLDTGLNKQLEGAGLTFNTPSFRDLSNEADNVSADEEDDSFTGNTANSKPKKIQTSREITVRLSRNQSWGSAVLAASLAGADPLKSIIGNVSSYWSRRLQAAFIATARGVFANNAADPVSGEHVKDDLTHDVSGTAFADGATNFTNAAFIDAVVTIGDSMDDLGLILMHSIVFARLEKERLVKYVTVAGDNADAITVPTYLGRKIIIDDAMPSASGKFETWIIGAGAFRLGVGTPKNATEVANKPDAGNGAGQEILYSRVEWAIHPAGHAYVGNASNGGPSNLETTNNLAAATSWKRVFPERKQIKLARLITREF